MIDVNRPLLGITTLIVSSDEDISERFRIWCLHSGSRVRRTDSLRGARRHLGVYMPSVILIEQGGSQGWDEDSGIELIRDLDTANARVPVILVVSDDEDYITAALKVGADGFISKIGEDLSAFQKTILDILPDELKPSLDKLSA